MAHSSAYGALEAVCNSKHVLVPTEIPDRINTHTHLDSRVGGGGQFKKHADTDVEGRGFDPGIIVLYT